MYSVRCFVNPLFMFIHLKAKAINKLKQEATREKGLTSGKLHHSLYDQGHCQCSPAGVYLLLSLYVESGK